MAIFNEAYVDFYLGYDPYVSFDEAVDMLMEAYDLSEEDAIFVVEDYIEEASAKDMERQKNRGERIYGQKRGMRITNHELNRPGRIDLDKAKYFKDAAAEYYKHDKINMDKVNNVKGKTDKEKVRDATRSIDSTVPKYGANPKYSRDADKRAVEEFIRATSKNPYKKIDIEKSIEGMDDKKAELVKRRLERGLPLPDSIKKRLAKKNDNPPSYSHYTDVEVPYNGKMITRDVATVYDNDEDFNKQRDRLIKMRQTTDPAEYHMMRREFLKDMGEKDYKGSIVYPEAGHAGNRKGFIFDKQSRKETERKNDGNDKYFHTSANGNIKELTPTPKAGEGIFYPQSRIYASQNDTTGRDGKHMSKEEAESKGIHRYELQDTKGKKINADDIATYPGRASFIKTSRTMPVKDIDKEDNDNKNKKK